MKYYLFEGDNLDYLKKMPDDFIDSLVCDPPAGISFMGKKWDGNKGGRDSWINWLAEIMAECYRVLKPGAHGLVWAIPKTSYWTGMALEKAGFEVRDCIHFIFGSGFPKSLNIGKAVDKLQGNERDIISEQHRKGRSAGILGKETEIIHIHDKGTSEWEGWGTALKPAVENWWLIRKPLSEKTTAKNCLKHKTGGINVDGCVGWKCTEV